MKRICIFILSFITVVALLSSNTVYGTINTQIESTVVETIPPTTEEPIIETIVKVDAGAIFNNFKQHYYYESLADKEEIYQRFSSIEDYVHNLKDCVLPILLNEGVEEEEAYNLINEEIENVMKIMGSYRIDYDRIISEEKWQKRYAEYYNATEVWLYFKNELQWSDEVAAGVMGNLMAETGGHTLAIQWQSVSGDGSVGICQWKTCFPDRAWLVHANLQQQLDFLKGNVKEQIDKWGFQYKEGFSYEDFCNLTDCKEAALAFAAAYERCNVKHYNVRTRNAEKALAYFTT